MTGSRNRPAALAGLSAGLDGARLRAAGVVTLSPLPGLPAASLEALRDCAGLLLPHDGQPVADVRDRPARWADLQLVTAAVRRGVPVLAWGSGAALLGRALGAPVHEDVEQEELGHGGPAHGRPVAWAELPRGAAAHVWAGARPVHWSLGRVTAWAQAQLPAELLGAFVEALPALASRHPASLLEELGGVEVLRAFLAAFYAQVRHDDLLGPVFAAHVRDWDAHLEHVTAFWVTMLGGGVAWRGNLNGVHAGLGVRAVHLDRWLALFGEAARAQLPPDAAAAVQARAQGMGARLGRLRTAARQDS